MQQPIIFHHSGSAGDVICSLATVKYVCETQNRKAKIVLDTDRFIQTQILKCWMPKELAESIKPLLESQDYVSEVIIVEKYNGHTDYNLDEFRKTYWNLGIRNLIHAHLHTFGLPLHIADKPFLKELPGEKANLIVMQVTPRYRNGLNYLNECRELAKENTIYFVGHSQEYISFLKEFPGIREYVEYFMTIDHYEIYKLLCMSKMFFGNGSSVSCIAEGLKMDAIYEIDPENPSLVFQRKGLILK